MAACGWVGRVWARVVGTNDEDGCIIRIPRIFSTAKIEIFLENIDVKISDISQLFFAEIRQNVD